MSNRQPQPQYEFEIDASVVYQLGEMLITDEVQALLELVKNSYDADASFVNIVVQTGKQVGKQSQMFQDAKGFILIEDDGTGMNWEEIKGGWLTISRSLKREMKQQGKTTNKGRTPIGEKGLGRLGTQRLGRYLEFWSKKQNSNIGHYVGIDWGDFRNKTLSQVPAYVSEFDELSKGTRLLITGLRTPEIWAGQKREALASQLSHLISPFESLRSFDVFLEIDGKREDLDKVSQAILDIADLEIKFDFDGKTLRIVGRFRPTFLRAEGQGQGVTREYEELIAVDGGADYYAFLNSKNLTQSPRLEWENKSGWFLSFEHCIELADLGEVGLVGESALSSDSFNDRKGEVANPGPFQGEIYSFPRRGANLDISNIFNSMSQYREYLNRLAGVRVFRDGFGIRPFGIGGDDWLELGKAWTSGTSYYGLRPQNVIGFVALTTANNRQLEETTSREYFVENPYSLNFYSLMKQVVVVANSVNEKLRRGYNDYKGVRARKNSGFTSRGVDEIFDQMRDTGVKSQDLVIKVESSHKKIEDTFRRVEKISTEVEASPLFHTEEERKVAPILREINQTLSDAKSSLEQVRDILSQTKELRNVADVIQPDLEYLRDQIEQFAELAGLGITAEALSHEMKNIADGLEAKTTNLVAVLRQKQSLDAKVLAYTEFVHSTLAGFRKQLSHLDPSLRYVREKRDVLFLVEFFKDIQDFYKQRFQRNDIHVFLEKERKDFSIFINRGKLTQVVDNLFLNSEYWLREDLRKSEINKAEIRVKIQKPFVDIYDTGRGISPSVEHQLFQPFVTTKPKGVGRGLGLFISRQLLESSNCQILLLPDKNQFDRRYIFRIDLTGVLHDG